MNIEYNVPNIFDEENSVIGKAMVIHAGLILNSYFRERK